MGYYMDHIDSAFEIGAEKIPALARALEEGYAHVCRADTPLGTVKATLEDANLDLSCESGGVDAVWFNGEKYLDRLDDLIEAMSPFVTDGSYLAVRGEDGCMWRWVWYDGKVDDEAVCLDWCGRLENLVKAMKETGIRATEKNAYDVLSAIPVEDLKATIRSVQEEVS